jgi:PAS domain S-box-containing protein
MLENSIPPIKMNASFENETIPENMGNLSVFRQNQIFLRAIEISFDAIVIGENDGTITYVNNAAIKMLGYPREELVGKNVLEFVAAQDRKRVLKMSIDAIRSAHGYLSQFNILRKDKSKFPVEVAASVIVGDEGKSVGFIDVIRILEGRKQTQDIIEESQILYKSLFENMLDGFAFCKILFDATGAPADFVYLEINDAFECLTGLRRADVVGKRVTEAIPSIKEANPELFEIYGRVALNGKPERFEIFFKPFSIWLDITVYSPKKEYFVTVFENITQHKVAEEKSEKYSKDLELTVRNQSQKLSDAQEIILRNERLAAIGQLAGMVGHDLRNPLSGIKNAAYLLRKKQPDLADSSVEMLNIINKAVEYSNKIIDDLLDFGRELHLEFEECSPKTLVDYVLLSFKIPKNIKIIDRTEYNPLFWVDASKMQRVFTNMIKNAFDAMLHGGTLEITSRTLDNEVELVLSDNGEGMSEETLSKIFTPLFTTKAQGMGFGLAICKRIVEAHGGKIDVTSVKGEGTAFKIKLPIEQKNNGKLTCT